MNSFWTDPTYWLHTAVTISLLALAVPAVFPPLYLLWLTFHSKESDSPVPLADAGRNLRFDIVVPAHDEAEGIAAVVENLLEIDWPRDQFRVMVIADNCSDSTAERARRAGALVVERRNLELRGKGYALRRAFSISLAQRYADAAVVVDADSRVSRNLLQAFAGRLAGGTKVAQVFHGVLDPDRNRRNRLMAIAYAAFHRVRSRGRERRGLSCGIRGNGWCISHQTLRTVPYEAHGLAEDIEYGLRLGIAGVRVEYIDSAQVLSSMETDMAGAATQRNRWEAGRSSLPAAFTRQLLAPSPASTRLLRRDLGFDLLVPPLATIALAVVLLTLVAGVAALALPHLLLPLAFLAGAAFASTALVIHVARGWQLSGTGHRGLLDLAAAPRFALWKLVLRFRSGEEATWVRTRRVTS